MSLTGFILAFNGNFPSNFVIPYDCFEIPLSNQKDNFLKKTVLFSRSLWIGIKVIKAKKKSVKILGIYRDESSLVLSYTLSLLTRLPLNIYLTDLYAEQYTRFLPKVLQRVIFRKAQKEYIQQQQDKMIEDSKDPKIARKAVDRLKGVNNPVTDAADSQKYWKKLTGHTSVKKYVR